MKIGVEIKDRWWGGFSFKNGLLRDTIPDSPFGLYKDYKDFRYLTIEFPSVLKKISLKKADFSYSHLNAKFKKCTFNNVIFKNIANYRVSDFSCVFDKCLFEKVNMNGAFIGFDGSVYKNCIFKNCNFKNALFIKPRFQNCVFDNCKLKGVDFNVSSFEDCHFVGELNDVWFRGNYALGIEEAKEYGNFKKNKMRNVDFSKAQLNWLTFTGVPLSDIILPDDEFVIYIDNVSDRLTRAIKKIPSIFTGELQSAAINYLESSIGYVEYGQNDQILTLADIRDYPDVDASDGDLKKLKRLLKK